MAEQGLRFIRKNGKIIPIRAKDPTHKQMRKNYEKYGDGANQASRIDQKYEDRARSKGDKPAYAGMAVAGAGYAAHKFIKNPKARLAAIGVAAAGSFGLFVGGHLAAARQRKRDVNSKENDYVKAFGMGTEGERPFKKRKKK